LVVALSPVCISAEVELALVIDGNTAVVPVPEVIAGVGRVVADRVADVEIMLPYWLTVAFVMLKNVLVEKGAVSFTRNSMRLNLLSKARSNVDPLSLPSTVTFQLYDC
jgi:hypothetical protein